MKIAFVVPYVPNLIRTRPYNLICQLLTLGNDITVFTLGHGVQDLKDVETLRSKGARVYYQKQPIWHSIWNSLKAVLSLRPLQTVYSWNPRFANQLVRLLSVPGAFDIVHVEHLRGSFYGQYIKLKLPYIPLVWDSVDCISYLFQQASKYNKGIFGKLITKFELGRTRRMEEKLIGEFNHVLVTSETDKNELLKLAAPHEKLALISVLSNGVDLDFFHPNPDIRRDAETLVFSGKMSYHANISMVKFLVSDIMPHVWLKRPNVRLIIVGKDPASDVKSLSVDPRIEVTGTVDDIRPYLWKATIAVVPLVYGAGIQNKILEAMACGTPVVATSKTLSSLAIAPGKEPLVIADGAANLSHAILRLLHDNNYQLEVSAAGENYVQIHHNWATITQQLIAIYIKTITDLR